MIATGLAVLQVAPMVRAGACMPALADPKAGACHTVVLFHL